MKICLLLQSTRVTAPDFATMVAACQLQLARDVSTAWERLAPELAIVTSAAEVPAGAALVVLLDTPDQANALGYHEELNDQPDGKVFAGPVLDNAGVVLRDTTNPQNTSVASVLSHELCELYIDVDANQYADGPAIKEGSSYAYEVCDPVQGVSYDVTTASGELVAVSDFVLPAWFDPEAPAGTRLDQAGQCKAPFTVVSGGYMIVRTAPGNESQVMGEEVPRWRGLSSRATRRYRGSGPIFCRVSPHRHTPILHGPMDHLGNFVGEFPNPHMPLSQDWNNHEALMKQRALTLEMARRDPFFEDSRLLNDVRRDPFFEDSRLLNDVDGGIHLRCGTKCRDPQGLDPGGDEGSSGKSGFPRRARQSHSLNARRPHLRVVRGDQASQCGRSRPTCRTCRQARRFVSEEGRQSRARSCCARAVRIHRSIHRVR